MKTILVPVDFSMASKVAVSYAIGLATKIKAKITLLSVINASASSNTLANWKSLEKTMVKSANRDAEDLIKQLSPGKTKISYQAILGYPITEMISQFAQSNEVDLIVMGSKGATGFKRAFVGSTAASMIQRSRIPVIVVPEKAKTNKVETLVYATDMKNLESEIEAIVRLTQHLRVQIHVLHVTKEKYSKLKRLEVENKLLRFPNAVFHIAKRPDLNAAIEAFTQEQKADLVVLFTHTLDFYEKMFGKSVTRQFAFKSTVPLLTFNRSNTQNII